MILNISGRTDVVAFYTPWLMKRYHEGYLDVRNPFYPKLVSRIYMKDVDLIVFCTKNPHPIIPHLKEIHHKILFQVTLTPYHKDIEPNVGNKKCVIEDIQKVAKIIGKEKVYVRYDPILVNEKYSIDYHIKAFEKMCGQLEGATSHIIVSFLDDYKNVRKNEEILKVKELTEEDYEKLGKSFSEIATRHQMSVQTCAEERTLFEYGFIQEDCVSKELAYAITGKKFKKWNARGKKCGCVEMVDIASYNTCPHFCKYCYANFDEQQVLENRKHHHPSSTLLIGFLEDGDEIKVRKG